ncbi:type I fimbriae usher protein [Pseudomonas chlororaphis]
MEPSPLHLKQPSSNTHHQPARSLDVMNSTVPSNRKTPTHHTILSALIWSLGTSPIGMRTYLWIQALINKVTAFLLHHQGYLRLTLFLYTTMSILPAQASTYTFSPDFLSDDPSAIADLALIEKNTGQTPGKYRVDIYLNNSLIGTKDVTFTVKQPSQNLTPEHQSDTNDSNLQACITRRQLEALPLKTEVFPAIAALQPEGCTLLAQVIPGAIAHLNFEQLRLDLSIPQAALRNEARGEIPASQWDQGINAALVNYRLTGGSNRGEGSDSQSRFLNLQSGLNIGAWRLRDNTVWSYNRGSDMSTQRERNHISTYAERPLPFAKGELTLGDSYTPSDVFDSLSFRGVQLASDDNMLPDSLRGFAPTVRGIAKSNAQVSIKQNGYVIYQSYVPPGPFTINDLYSTSSNGDLQVTLTEADGSQENYTVPYSTVPILQREGHFKYALTAGRYRSTSKDQSDPRLFQASLIWGLPKGYTVYGGTQYADNYRALALGVGKNLGDWGALSVDITQANSALADGSQHKGQSLRFLYAKSLNQWGTNFQLLGYRYSTQGFYTLDETGYKAMSGYVADNNDTTLSPLTSPVENYNLYYSKRGKMQVNISQQIGSLGSVFVTASQQSYWHTNETDSLLQAGYNTSVVGVNLSLTYNYSQSPGQNNTNQVYALNVSVPLDRLLPSSSQSHHSTFATYSNSTDTKGSTTQSLGISGTLLAQNSLNYSVQQSQDNHSAGGNGNASLNYQGSYANADLGYSYSHESQQTSYGLSGGIVAHADGVTLSQPLSDTNVLIKAPGAAHVNVENTTGVKTNGNGYAVMPFASAYHQNRVALDTDSLGPNVDLDETTINVVPTRGAIVKAEFATRVGVRAVLILTSAGKPVPFGATVSRADFENAGIVGDDGQVYLSGLPLQGTVKVKWGKTSSQQCTATYQLADKSLDNTITYAKAACS